MKQLEDGNEEFKPFEMDGLCVEMKYNDTDKLEVRGIVKDENKNVLDDFTKTFDYASDEFGEWLKDLGKYVIVETLGTQNYAVWRTDYTEVYRKRDY